VALLAHVWAHTRAIVNARSSASLVQPIRRQRMYPLARAVLIPPRMGDGEGNHDPRIEHQAMAIEQEHIWPVGRGAIGRQRASLHVLREAGQSLNATKPPGVLTTEDPEF